MATDYLVAYLTANAVAYKVTGEEKYREEAIAQEEKCCRQYAMRGILREAGALRYG